MQRYTMYFIWKLLYMFRGIPPPIVRSANNCIYSILYLAHRYCYLPLSWKSWNCFECAISHSNQFQLFECAIAWIFRTFEGVVGTGWSWLRKGTGGG